MLLSGALTTAGSPAFFATVPLPVELVLPFSTVFHFVSGGPANWAVDSESRGRFQATLHTLEAENVAAWQERFVDHWLDKADEAFGFVKSASLVLWLSHLVPKKLKLNQYFLMIKIM